MKKVASSSSGGGKVLASSQGEGESRLCEYFGPLISVLGTSEAESLLSSSNNLSPAELLQPFSTLSEPLTLKDPEGAHSSISSLSVSFRDFKRDPHRSINSKLISDSVSASNNTEEAFKAFQTLFLASLPPAEHEYLRSELGVVLVASAGEHDPLGALQTLRSSSIETHLRKRSNADYPLFALEEPWIAYLILGEAEASPDYLASLPSQTHYLRINRGTSSTCFNPWFSNLTALKFCDLHSRLKGLGTTTLATTANASLLHAPPASLSHESGSPVDHPLAREPEEPMEDTSKHKLIPATPDNVASSLGEEDFEGIRRVVRDMVIRGLVPFVEKQMRVLQEVATNRKSRSLFSGAKRWFGQGKPGTSSGTSVVYGREAPELQVRKLGDLYFMFKLYKHAYSCYHSIKKDFQSDEAWNYYAGASEMAALSSFMQLVQSQDLNGKKYPSHYMEDAILKYQQVCQMPDFALRATLFDALCLRQLGMYEESAKSYIRMTTDAKDLRSSLLLEQAAFCYLKCKPALNRKYAFYIILAAYKYSKSGQKRHSSRAYEKGYEIYKGHNWSLSEDHILYNLGHLALLLKDHASAASLFNELFQMTLPVVNPLQQMCHLREFFIVQHLREKEDKTVREIPIPKFAPQELVLDLNNDRTSRYESLIHANPKSEWTDLEKVITEHIREAGASPAKSCQSVYGPKSANNLPPQGAVEETLRYLIPISNEFQTGLLLKQIYLLWRFEPQEGEPLTNEDPLAGKFVQTDVLESFNLEKSSQMVMALTLKPLQPGRLFVTGVEYSLKAQFSQSESTDYTIRGRQGLSVRGPRLTSMKDMKAGGTHGPDTRLEVAVHPSQPRLFVKFLSELPEFLYSGEIRVLEMEVGNVGKVPLGNCLILSIDAPGLFSFGGKKKSLYEYPLISDLCKSLENGQTATKSLDVVPLPLGHKTLDPGKSMKLRVFMRSPQSLGLHALKIHFYYENANEGPVSLPRHRILSHMFNVKVIPVLELRAALHPPFVYNNARDTVLGLNLDNVSAGQRPLESVSVTQIGLISRDKSISNNLSGGDDILVRQGESLKLCINAASSSLEAEEGVHFSDMKSKSIQGSYSFHSPPYLDFLKTAFAFPPKCSPQLRNDVAAVIWRSGELNGLMLTDVHPEAAPLEDDSSLTVKTKFPLRVEVKSEAVLEVDFESLRVFRAPFKVMVQNLANRNLYLHYMCGSRNILGCTLGTDVLLESSSLKTLNLKAAITAPGLFHLHGGVLLQVTDSPLGSSDPSELDLVPIDITFIVRNKTSVII